MSSIRPIDSHQNKHDLHTLMNQQKTISPSTIQTPDNSLQHMQHISQAVTQTRTLLQRRIRLNHLSNQSYNETPTLGTEDGEDVFAKLHGLNSKTVLQGKAKQFLQRMRKQQQYGGQTPLLDNEEQANLPISYSNQEGNEFSEQPSVDQVFAQAMQEALGEEASSLDMYLILGQAKQMLAQDNSKLSKDVSQQLDSVFNEHQDEIVTKVNSIDEASIYGGTEKKRVTQFLEAYYTFIFKVKTPNDMLMVYLNSFDRAEFEQISNLFSIANLKAQHQRLLPCIHQNTMNDILPFMNNRSAIFSLLDYIASSQAKLAKRFDQLQQNKTPQVDEKSLLKTIQELFSANDKYDVTHQEKQEKEKQENEEHTQQEGNHPETMDDDDLFDKD